MPKRIQRKRIKGWRMPENTIYVGRPSRWGNPFSVVEIKEDRFFRDEKMWTVIDLDNHGWSSGEFVNREAAVRYAIELYRSWIKSVIRYTSPGLLRELRGKDLACWCKEENACHADVLLELLEES